MSEKETQPYIVDTPCERRLHFTDDVMQSTMMLADPDALIAPYTRKMMSFLLFNPCPTHILIIGLGGGSLPKFCYRWLQHTDITVVEINRDVIALRDQFHIPKDDQRFRVLQEDGAKCFKRLDNDVDVILIDAFDARGVARSFTQFNFYAQAAERLTKNGVLVMNLLGETSRYVDNIKQVRKAFGKNVMLVPVMSSENVLLFALRQPAPTSINEELESLAQRLQSHLQLDFPQFLRRICQGHSLVNR